MYLFLFPGLKSYFLFPISSLRCAKLMITSLKRVNIYYIRVQFENILKFNELFHY